MNKWQTAIVSFLLIGMVGCQQNNNATEEGRHDEAHNTKYQEVKQTVDEPNKRQNLSSQAIARHLVRVAEKTPNVRDATAIVTMGYAVVGIDLDKDIDRSQTGTIKHAVAQSLKDDRYGANAIVVADPDTVQRLKNMGKDIRDGRPISGVMDQLSQIVNRVVPEVPYNMNRTEKNQPSTRQQQDGQLPQGQQRQLHRKQNDGTKPGPNEQAPNPSNRNSRNTR